MVNGRAAVTGWVLYDLANTIFSFNVLSLYFPLWASEHLGAADIQLSIAFGVSMGLVAILSPVLGVLSDRARRRMPLLMLTTTLCVGATATLGILPLGTALVAYAFANVFFQLGLVVYDALLPEVSTPDNVGRIGGLGVGIGYLGSFVGLGAGALLLANLEPAHPTIFVVTAVLFLGLALPCFIWVRERERAARPLKVRATFAQLARTARDVVRHRSLGLFLIARFIYADAANTLIIFMGIYAVNEAGFSEEGVQFVLGVGILAAMIGGLVIGRFVDRLGPRRVLKGVLVLWMGALALAAAIPLANLAQAWFWLVAAGAGTALGGTWTADRPLMLALTPADRVGEFYGVYGMVGRFAAVVGPLGWGLIVDVLEWGRPVAVLSLLGAMLISYGVLSRVRAR